MKHETPILELPTMRTVTIRPGDPLPPGIDTTALVEFLHENMKPFEDTPAGTRNGVDFALSEEPGKGGAVILALEDGAGDGPPAREDGAGLVGAVVVVRTGLSVCVPENLLLFAAVIPARRGRGIGGRLIREAMRGCEGDVKLHVEYDNPARRLYERLGFVNKYADMRCRR